MRRWLWALLLVGCTRVPVLEAADAGPVRLSCKDAVPGDACAFLDECPVSTSPCCWQSLVCKAGVAVLAPEACEADCKLCKEDADCGVKALCTGGRCTGCPAIDKCVPPASGLWVELTRNGCSTCDFAPSFDCAAPGECGPGSVCYRGLRCASGCVGFECCANACSAPGCKEPAPLGCKMKCTDPCACVAGYCWCQDGKWNCKPVCADDVATSCVFVPEG